MADAILYGVVQTIIENLDSSTLKQMGSIWGVKDELEKMKNDVLTIQAVLEDAEEKQVQNHQVRHWLMKLREVVFDADDLLSEFNTHVLRQKVRDGNKIVKKVRIFFSSSNPLVFGLEMARKIKVMRERINDMARDRNNLQLVERPLLVTRTVTMGRVQSAISDYGNWVSNGTTLDFPVSIFSLFPAYESETDVSSVFNDSPPRFSHSNSIMSIYAPARSETDSSENYEIIPNPSIMSIFSPARSQLDISENYENFPNPSIMSIFSPARSQPDISENYENFPNPSIMSIFSPYHISIFSPTISETGSSLSIGSTHSIPLLFPANKSETDSGSESNETPPQFSYPMMSIFPPNRSQTYSFIPDEEEVIGREKERQAIIEHLLDFDVEDNVSFISIVGIGGLGKTTLVQYVFNDERVQTNFELKIWVCVSDVFDIKKIVGMIIGSTTGRKPENLDMGPLQNELRETLHQKKYLLILDDVWNEDSENWYNLKKILMGGAKGSKVVITTRSNKVVETTSTISSYFLKGLSMDQSWSLLKKMAFKKGQETINRNLEEIGMDILEKCQGVPLAIRTIGRVLNHKETEAEWLYIKNSKLTYATQFEDGIMPVLKLSYDYLPSHLKCCFAYCSLFPKDYLFDKLTLIQLWISQGFIQSSEESHELEHVANEYFMELLWRSFFEEAKEDGGMNRRFKMHDLIHDLAQYVSQTDCTLVDTSAKNVKEKGHHLSFPFYNVSFFEENLSTLVKANKIRTFILAYNKWKYDQEQLKNQLSKNLFLLLNTCVH